VIHLSLSFVDVGIVTETSHDPIIIYPLLEIRASHHSKTPNPTSLHPSSMALIAIAASYPTICLLIKKKYNLIQTLLWNLVKDPSVIVINLKLTFDCPAFPSCYSLRASICVVDCTSRPHIPRLNLSLIFLSLNPSPPKHTFFSLMFVGLCRILW
jgi:hypothetical protein